MNSQFVVFFPTNVATICMLSCLSIWTFCFYMATVICLGWLGSFLAILNFRNKMFCSIPQYLEMSRKLNKTATINEEVDGITLGCLFSGGRELNNKQDGMWVPPWICSQAKVALLRKVWLLIPTSMTKSESSKKQTGFRESVKIPGITLEPCKKFVA